MGKIKSDIEIAREAKMKPIQEILDGVGVPDKTEAYSPISRYIAKIKLEYLEKFKDKKAIRKEGKNYKLNTLLNTDTKSVKIDIDWNE